MSIIASDHAVSDKGPATASRNFSPAPHLFPNASLFQCPPLQQNHRNTIAGSPPGKRIFIYFEKKRFASQKLNFSIFVS
jgi:hypothetical protein